MLLAFAFYVCCSGHIGVTLALVGDQVVTGCLVADASGGSALAVVVTLGEAEEALEESVLLLLLLAGGLLGVGGRGLLVDLGAGGGETTLHGADAALEAGDDDGDKGGGNGLLKSARKDLLNSLGDHLREHVDDGLQDTELRAQGLNVASDRVDIAVQGIDVGRESTNVSTDGIDMLTNGVNFKTVSIIDGAMIVYNRLLSVGDVAKTIGTEADRASSIEKSMLDHAKDFLQDTLHVVLGDAIGAIGSHVGKAITDLSEDVGHTGTTRGKVLLNSLVLNGVMDSMLDKAVKVGLSMKTLDHVLNTGADVASLSALTMKTITLSNGAGELDKEDSGLTHAVPLRAGGITTSLAKTNEASVVIEHGLHVIVRSSGARELSVGASLGKVTTHGLNHDGAVGTTIDDNSDGGLGRGHVTSTVTLGGGSGRAVSHGAISDRGLDVNARVNREGRGLGRLVLGGGLGVDRKLGLSRSHCFGLVVDV